MIGVTLVKEGREIDLLIPTRITLGRLQDLVKEIFRENGVVLPDGFKLVIQGKNLQLGETDLLSDFGIATGDKFEIQLGE
ncbi:EsaB/YukD family protein [Streptococcus cuniculi]|uniref:Type VII secretion protein, YukD family n=1 Tax=Streptococcus cuniculi TaxID=1432788 RepID=A0A4Y9JEY2_9STRE|nr:EsaB/YukD family protein [Streptococcus cuniculi]MBF0777453.1 type VII secretion protein, YukD family [Streptococcus cuniculi]TFU98509.1 type VII secretion protein, YukD family [Streptococcus cuniculi]